MWRLMVGSVAKPARGSQWPAPNPPVPAVTASLPTATPTAAAAAAPETRLERAGDLATNIAWLVAAIFVVQYFDVVNAVLLDPRVRRCVAFDGLRWLPRPVANGSLTPTRLPARIACQAPAAAGGGVRGVRGRRCAVLCRVAANRAQNRRLRAPRAVGRPRRHAFRNPGHCAVRSASLVADGVGPALTSAVQVLGRRVARVDVVDVRHRAHAVHGRRHHHAGSSRLTAPLSSLGVNYRILLQTLTEAYNKDGVAVWPVWARWTFAIGLTITTLLRPGYVPYRHAHTPL